MGRKVETGTEEPVSRAGHQLEVSAARLGVVTGAARPLESLSPGGDEFDSVG